MISPSIMGVLEFVPSEAFLSASLSGDEDKLYTTMVFAEFPRKKMSTLSALQVEHLEWELRQCQDGIKNWTAALPCVPNSLKNGPSHKILCHCSLRI